MFRVPDNPTRLQRLQITLRFCLAIIAAELAWLSLYLLLLA
jgi:hypothetical protein